MLLRCLPFPETEEFVNLGVVVSDAQTGRLTSRIELVKEKRVTESFHGLDLAAFRYARSIRAAEIQRMEQFAVGNGSGGENCSAN